MQQKMLKLKQLQSKLASIQIPQNQEYHQRQNSQSTAKQIEQRSNNQYSYLHKYQNLHNSQQAQILQSSNHNKTYQNSSNYHKYQSFQPNSRYKPLEPLQTAVGSDETKNHRQNSRIHQVQSSLSPPYNNNNIGHTLGNPSQPNLLSLNYNFHTQKPTVQNSSSSNKGKLKTLQTLVARISANYQQENMNQQYRINSYLEQIRKIQTTGKQYAQKMEQRQHSARGNLVKLQKMIKKGIEKMLKDRRDVDKKVQSSLQGYLIQLSGLKSKTQSNCQSIIRDLQNLQSQVLSTEKEVQNETLMSKQVMKKVYSQFNSQIQQLADMLIRERKQREQQQQVILGMLQKVYNRITNDLQQGKKLRQKSDQQVVDLLERVIEKVRFQMIRQ